MKNYNYVSVIPFEIKDPFPDVWQNYEIRPIFMYFEFISHAVIDFSWNIQDKKSIVLLTFLSSDQICYFCRFGKNIGVYSSKKVR